MTLLGRPDLSPGDNPVGPKAVATGLVALCKALDDDHDRALDRVTRLEEHFAEFLPGVHLALNDFLVSRKVSAAQPTLRAAMLDPGFFTADADPARQLPQVLPVLPSRMKRVSVPETARAEFLDTCFAPQTAAMCWRSGSAQVPQG